MTWYKLRRFLLFQVIFVVVLALGFLLSFLPWSYHWSSSSALSSFPINLLQNSPHVSFASFGFRYLHICRDEKEFLRHLAWHLLHCTFLWSWGKEKDADSLLTSHMPDVLQDTHINPMWFYTLLSETAFLGTMLCLSCGQIRMFLIRNSQHIFPFLAHRVEIC